MAAVDHGPHAPSIAIARMAATCGLPLNSAMASAINALDDVHGGAGEQCMELYRGGRRRAPATARRAPTSSPPSSSASSAAHGKIVPGFGHRWHRVDPRAARLLALVREAEAAGVVRGRFAAHRPRASSAADAQKGGRSR